MQPIIHWALIILNFGRLLLLLAAFKCLSVAKVMVYYEVVIITLESFMPMDVNMERSNEFHLQKMQALFLSYYFRFCIDGVTIGLTQVAHTFGRALILSEDAGKASVALESGWNLIQFSFSSTLIHFLISWACLIYVESQISCFHYESILDKMDSGVMMIS